MPIIKTADVKLDTKNNFVVRDRYVYVLPAPQNEDYGHGIKGFISALVNETNEQYKEKVRKDFGIWTKFKRANKNNYNIYTDINSEKEITDWLTSPEIQLSQELKEILKSYIGKIYPTKEELLKK